jgi:hypothetical protein
MKRIVAAVSFFLIAALAVNAQDMRHAEAGPLKKIEELDGRADYLEIFCKKDKIQGRADAAY